MAIKSWSPLEKRERGNDTAARTTTAAQNTADGGHLGGCLKQILNTFPSVLFTQDNLATLAALFPSTTASGGVAYARGANCPSQAKIIWWGYPKIHSTSPRGK
eukprot:scaffold134974_cov63-Attheya_sp.AAC.3